MTETNQKIRGVLLAGLMVLSVFAGTVVFTGGVAAASAETGSSGISPSTVDESTTTTLTVTLNATDVNTNDSTAQVFSVRLPSSPDFDTTSTAVTNEQVITGNVTFSGTTVDSTNDVINVTLGDDNGVDSDTVTVSFDINVTAPATNGDVSGQAQFGIDENNDNSLETGYADFQQLTVQDTGSVSGEDPRVTGSVELSNDGSTQSVDGQNAASLVEVSFNEDVLGGDGTALTSANVTTYVNGVNKSSAYTLQSDGSSGTIVLTSSTDLDPSDTVSVHIDAFEDADGNTVTDRNVSVTVTGATLSEGTSRNTFKGTPTAFVVSGDGEDLTITKNASGEFLFAGSTGSNSQVYVFKTDSRETITYKFETDTSSYLSVRNLGLTASADQKTFNVTDGTADAPIDVSANAGNRQVDYTVYYTNNDSVASQGNITLDGSGEGAISANFPAPGEYYVTVTDANTGVSTTIEGFAVNEVDGIASFQSSVFNVERGDVGQVTINLDNLESAQIYLGSDEANFLTEFTVTDGNDDGQVTVTVNTYKTASDRVTDEDSIDFLGTVAEDDSVSSVSVIENVSNPIDTGTYDLNVSTAMEEAEMSVSALSVNPVDSSPSASSYIAPKSTSPSGKSVSTLVSAASQQSTVAQDDWAVAQFDVAGVEGYFNASNLNESGDDGLTVQFTETDPGANQDPRTFSTDNANVQVKTDLANDTFLVLWNTEDVSIPSDGDSNWNVTFSINSSANAVYDSDASVTTQFSVEEPTATVNGGEDVVVPQGNASIDGTTNLAPGTEFNVRTQASGQNSFLLIDQVTVQEDGRFAADYDFSDVANGTGFSITLSESRISTNVGGTVVAGAGGTTTGQTTTADQTTTQGTTQQTTQQTPTSTGGTTTQQTTAADTTTEQTDGGTPGFGVGLALVAVIGAALLALRRED